jgi:hypothetical protein
MPIQSCLPLPELQHRVFHPPHTHAHPRYPPRHTHTLTPPYIPLPNPRCPTSPRRKTKSEATGAETAGTAGTFSKTQLAENLPAISDVQGMFNDMVGKLPELKELVKGLDRPLRIATMWWECTFHHDHFAVNHQIDGSNKSEHPGVTTKPRFSR